jgi:hypothetical protein
MFSSIFSILTFTIIYIYTTSPDTHLLQIKSVMTGRKSIAAKLIILNTWNDVKSDFSFYLLKL